MNVCLLFCLSFLDYIFFHKSERFGIGIWGLWVDAIGWFLLKMICYLIGKVLCQKDIGFITLERRRQRCLFNFLSGRPDQLDCQCIINTLNNRFAFQYNAANHFFTAESLIMSCTWLSLLHNQITTNSINMADFIILQSTLPNQFGYSGYYKKIQI